MVVWRSAGGRRRRLAAVPAFLLVSSVAASALLMAGRSTACEIDPAFVPLYSLVPAEVGTCVEGARPDPSSGDLVQQTTNGLLVYRLKDRTPVFTDGYSTWVYRLGGVERRPNSEQFDWEAAPGREGEPAFDLVLLGDSHVQLWDTERAFAPLWTANRGVYGQTSRQILARLRTDLVDLRPRVALIVAGVNDIFAGVPLSETTANLRSMWEESRASGVIVIAATCPPARAGSEVGAERLSEFNRRVRELNRWILVSAPSFGAIPVDLYSLLADDLGELAQRFSSSDGLHLNEQGYDEVTRLVKSHVLALSQ